MAMSKARVDRLISLAWWPFLQLAERHAYELVHEALRVTEEQERAHRAMGKRICNAGYRVGVERTARYFVMRNTFRAIEAPKTWTEFAGFRRDIAICQAIREKLAEAGVDVPAELHEGSEFWAIDYAEDIAA